MNTQTYKDFTLDGNEYTITMLPADQGLKVLTRLTKLVGAPLMELGKAQKDKEHMMDHLKNAVILLGERMEEDEVVSLVIKLLSCVIYKPHGSYSLDKKWTTHFQGKYGQLFKLLTEVVDYNYEDFFAVLPTVNQSSQSAVQK